MYDTLVKNLMANEFKVSCFETGKEAAAYISSQITGRTVGIGGSVTVAETGLYDLLRENNTVYWHNRLTKDMTDTETRQLAAGAEIYISSVNAIAETGEIVNIDNICNRVASIFYGHKKVYLIIGKNKIAPDEASAIYRARNIASPLNAKRLGRKTPCAVNADRCYNCSSPERICRGLSVLWKKPARTEAEVILVNEDLGY